MYYFFLLKKFNKDEHKYIKYKIIIKNYILSIFLNKYLGFVHSVSLSFDEKSIISCSADKNIMIWYFFKNK